MPSRFGKVSEPRKKRKVNATFTALDDDDRSSGKEVSRQPLYKYVATERQVVDDGSSIHLGEEIVPPWHAAGLSCFLFPAERYPRLPEKSDDTWTSSVVRFILVYRLLSLDTVGLA